MIRIALSDATSRDALDDLAAALGLLLVNIVPRTETYPAQVIYVTPDRQAMVHLVDEGASGALAWLVRGGSEAIEACWAEALQKYTAAPRAAVVPA